MYAETDLAYTAGLFDGEGHVGITATKNGRGESYHRLMINVTSTDMPIIVWLFETFGGVMHSPRYQTKKEWRTAYRWTASDGKAAAFLVEILPYLRIKKEQAEIAIKFQSTKGKGGFGSVKPDVEGRESMRQQISALNRGK